jgi:hypothetical protein
MVETIAPVVYGTRNRWRAAVILHALGATASAVAFGAALGALGAGVGAPFGRAGATAIVVLGLAYAAGELPRVRLPVPQWRRQVPDWWRTFFGWPVSSFLYGLGLGIGFATFLAHGTLVVVAAAALAGGDPLVGAVIVGPFGLARGLSALAGSGVRDPASGSALIDRLVERPPAPPRRPRPDGSRSARPAAGRTSPPPCSPSASGGLPPPR